MLLQALAFTHSLIKEAVQPGDTVIDATIGNGHDTLLLAQLVGATGKVIGFDIQKQAILNTENRLKKADAQSSVSLYNQGHETIKDIIDPDDKVALVIFNLGYLPKGDKTVVTTPKTTLEGIKQSLTLLKKNGLLLLMVYHGHDGGTKEKNAILDFSKSLPQERYSVLNYQYLNQKNDPPFLIAIEKRKE